MGDFENVKAAADLKEYAAEHLEPGRDKGTYICPKCKSGTGRNKTAAFQPMPDGMRMNCFACGWKPDIFELAGWLKSTDEPIEQLRIVAEWAGVAVEGNAPRGFQQTMNARAATAATAEPKAEEKPDYSEGRAKHRAYIAECARRMREEPDERVDAFLSAKGITHDEAVAWGIGYDPRHKAPWYDTEGVKRFGVRVVIPWAGCDYYHADRAIDASAKDGKYYKPKSDEVGEQPLYNPQAFDGDYVIAVEGELDALAITKCGYNAVGIGGTNRVGRFANECAERNYPGVVIDMLDCDGDANDVKNGKGRRAGRDLIDLLAEAGITTLCRLEYGITDSDDYGGHKDAGEWFAADRADLADMLEVMRGIAHEKAARSKDAEYREALRNLNVKNPANVARDVLELRDVYEPVATGIPSLDEALGGGVSLGETTFFGAVSSYGKTTLAVQIADHMASAGRSVLFVTIEQSAKELVAKSLSRLVFTENTTGSNIATPQEITSLRTRKAWGEGQRATLAKAVDDYGCMIAPKMRILEGNRQPTVADVRAVAEAMAEHDGQAPVIFIDYLQLLAPLSARQDSDKRNADMNVTELRKMARDLKTHVWCISSLNRSSYSGVISLDSFKESGGIEYGADNLLGLQPRNMAAQLEGVADSKMKREADKLIRENKKKTERDCELVILKQRNGALPDAPLPLTFKPMAAYFMEPTSAARQAQARTRASI